jgi:hypothetical protein
MSEGRMERGMGGEVSARQPSHFCFGKSSQKHVGRGMALRVPCAVHRHRRRANSLRSDTARLFSGAGCTARPCHKAKDLRSKKRTQQRTRFSRHIMPGWSGWFSCMEDWLKGEAEACCEIHPVFRESEIGAKNGRTLQRESAADPVALAHAFLEEF